MTLMRIIIRTKKHKFNKTGLRASKTTIIASAFFIRV